MKIFILSLFGLIFINSAALADPRCPSDDYSQDWCAATINEKEKNTADKELNRIYKKFIKQLPERALPSWISAQRAWVEFFQRHCSAASTIILGSPSNQTAELNSCLKDKIIQRTTELKSYCQMDDCNDF